ncbi:hypothetical protein Tco_0634232, partial [Tanacetum coccineum]
MPLQKFLSQACEDSDEVGEQEESVT